jgi:hypothetical protein
VTARLVAWVAALVLAAPVVARAQGATIGEIRVHGNYATPDEDVLVLSGLKIGEPATDERLAAAQKALEASDRFDDVEVRRRFRSIDDPADILVMILVRERPGVSRGRPHAGHLQAAARAAAVDADSQLRRRLRVHLRRANHVFRSGRARHPPVDSPVVGW